MRTNNRSIISITWLMMFVLTAFYGLNGPAWAQTEVDSPSWELKLDAEARLLLSSFDDPESEQTISLYDSISFNDDEDEDRRLVDVFVLLDDPENAPLLDEIGVERRTQVKDIVVARLPVESLPLLAQQPYVRFVETSTIQSLRMDASRPEIQADQVHQGINLPQSYEGEGVVVGIVDYGIDFTHPDFSDSGGTRIQYLLEYTQGGGQNEWTKSQIDANPGSVTLRGTAFDGHGTHVAGIAVGGGKANPLYRGIAPKADIILVEALRFTTDIAEACDYIFKKAQALGKPAVINLSLGGHNNPHDGSSLYEQTLSNLTGPGRIIVASAGNEGWTASSPALAVHAGGTVVPNTIYGAMLQALNDPTQTQLNIWYDQDVINGVMVIAYNNQFMEQDYTAFYDVGQITSSPLMLHDSNGAVLGAVYIDASTVNDPRNGDGNILMKITNNGDPAVDIRQTYWLVAFIAQASGDVHMWPLLERDAFRYDINFSGIGLTNLPVDSNCTVGSPASAKKVISVGSYVTKNSWIDLDGTAQQWPGYLLENPLIGELSILSSKGPTRDKRIAPTICAPGERIVSALSSHLTEGIGYNRSDVVQGGSYLVKEGTSMSAPHVTGTVALMLEVNPNLDYDQVVNILQSTARSDGFTGNSLPDNMFGAGKVDALAAVQDTNAAATTATLIHSYTFEDGTANDSIGSAHGTLVGGAAVVSGALVTSAQDQWMEMPGNVIAMNTFNEVTIEAWYTPSAGANTGWTMLAYFGDSVNGLGSNGFFMTSARGDDKSRAAISIGDIATPYASETGADGPEYDDGLLHHMVSTIEDTDITLYIDGVLIDSTPLDPHNSISGISQNFAYLAKGGYDADPEWIGSIDEFNIYNQALSQAEIGSNYAAGPQKVIPVPPVFVCADPHLRAAIESTLGVTNLTRTDMLNLTSLYADGLGITDLSCLETAVNLTSLSLADNQITDVNALAGLTKLTELWLNNNQITDVNALAGMTNLTCLGLSNNQITDVNALAGLTNLIDISLSDNQITNVSALAGMTNLTELWLNNNQITDVNALAGMTKLNGLRLNNNQISNITPLAGMTNLNLLKLYNNQISNITPLAGMTDLNLLWLDNNRITDLSPLLNLRNLMLLSVLTGNPLSQQAINVQIPHIKASGIMVQ